jgi:hypothetical protein
MKFFGLRKCLAIFPSRASSQEEALKPHLFTCSLGPLSDQRERTLRRVPGEKRLFSPSGPLFLLPSATCRLGSGRRWLN